MQINLELSDWFNEVRLENILGTVKYLLKASRIWFGDMQYSVGLKAFDSFLFKLEIDILPNEFDELGINPCKFNESVIWLVILFVLFDEPWYIG